MRRRALLAFVVGVVLLLFGGAPATAATTIDTTSAWDGSQFVHPFGRPDTATYGQVFTAPANDTVLDSFTIYLRDVPVPPYSDPSVSRTITFRGELYAWDGTKATGLSLWESAPRTVTLDETFRPASFLTGGVQLVAGQPYIFFASVSKDYEQNPELALGAWGYTGGDVYAGGGFFFENNGTDESQWTSRPWETFLLSGWDDLAFRAIFSAPLPTSKEQCKNGGWQRFRVFKNQGDCVSFVATGGRNQPAGGQT
jgi:hypothetical protein